MTLQELTQKPGAEQLTNTPGTNHHLADITSNHTDVKGVPPCKLNFHFMHLITYINTFTCDNLSWRYVQCLL